MALISLIQMLPVRSSSTLFGSTARLQFRSSVTTERGTPSVRCATRPARSVAPEMPAVPLPIASACGNAICFASSRRMEQLKDSSSAATLRVTLCAPRRDTAEERSPTLKVEQRTPSSLMLKPPTLSSS